MFSNELHRIAEASKTPASCGEAEAGGWPRVCGRPRKRPNRAGDSALPHLPGPKPKLHKQLRWLGEGRRAQHVSIQRGQEL